MTAAATPAPPREPIALPPVRQRWDGVAWRMAAGVSVALHLAILIGPYVQRQPDPYSRPEEKPVEVEIVTEKDVPKPEPQKPPEPEKPKPEPPKAEPQPEPPKPESRPEPAKPEPQKPAEAAKPLVVPMPESVRPQAPRTLAGPAGGEAQKPGGGAEQKPLAPAERPARAEQAPPQAAMPIPDSVGERAETAAGTAPPGPSAPPALPAIEAPSAPATGAALVPLPVPRPAELSGTANGAQGQGRPGSAAVPPSAAAAAAAGGSAPGVPGPGAQNELMDYLARLRDRIVSRRGFPIKGDPRAGAVVRLVISREGELLARSVHETTGDPELDRQVLAVVDRAKPFRPLPPSLSGPLTLDLPAAFVLK